MLWKWSPVQNLSAFVRMAKVKDIFPSLVSNERGVRLGESEMRVKVIKKG